MKFIVRKTLRVFGIVIGCIAVFLCYVLITNVYSPHYLGKGNVVLVHSLKSWEVNRGIYFRIYSGLKKTHEGCLIITDLPWDPHKFKVLQSDDKQIISIHDTVNYGMRPLVMCKLDSMTCWPCGDVKETIRDEMFIKIQANNPSIERPGYWDQ